MNQYVIYTDSACDISEEDLRSWGVGYCPLTFKFTNSDQEYTDYEMPKKEFYAKMRAGEIAKTSAVNIGKFKALFEDELKKGNDILYIGFSSGLSTTCNSARLAAEELKVEYPDRKLMTIDTFGASAGFGLLLYLAVKQKDSGKSMEEVYNFVKDMRFKLCHWFTVDDLVYLKRGGRVSPTAAAVGNLLGIKPVLHVDNEGKLIPMFKVRGRKTSIKALADKLGELMDKNYPEVFISHGDCIDDVKYLESILEEKYGVKVTLVTYVGAVIGSHSGPGTLALFFVTDKER